MSPCSLNLDEEARVAYRRGTRNAGQLLAVPDPSAGIRKSASAPPTCNRKRRRCGSSRIPPCHLMTFDRSWFGCSQG
eukprot:4669872-Pyramimonas_sp.AAC.2